MRTWLTRWTQKRLSSRKWTNEGFKSVSFAAAAAAAAVLTSPFHDELFEAFISSIIVSISIQHRHFLSGPPRKTEREHVQKSVNHHIEIICNSDHHDKLSLITICFLSPPLNIKHESLFNCIRNSRDFIANLMMYYSASLNMPRRLNNDGNLI